MSYITQCPECSGDLYLHSFTATVDSVRIRPDGFDLHESKHTSTSDEMVICTKCALLLPLRDDEFGPYSPSSYKSFTEQLGLRKE